MLESGVRDLGDGPGTKLRRSLLDMFLRVVHSSIDPAKIDDVLALKDDVIAATKKQAGFVSFQGGASRATRQCSSRL